MHPAIMISFSLGAASAAAVTALLLQHLQRRSSSRARWVPAPHPGWAPGQPQPPPFDSNGMLSIDPAATDKAAIYAFMISAVVPRPIAFVSSQDAAGRVNLSPYSYYGCMGHNPPLVAIGICRSPSRGGGKKDTLQNIEETGEFVVNTISDWYVEAANHTCGEYARGVDEMALAGLHPVASTVVAPPRVREAALQMECRMLHVYEVDDRSGKPSTAVVIGEVVMIHLAKEVAGTSPSGKLVVNPVTLAPVVRLGGVTYGRVTELFDLARPDGSGNYPGRS